MSRTPLAARPTVNNWQDAANVPGLHEDNLPRDAGLQIRLLPSRDRYWLSPLGPLFDPAREWFCEVPLRPEDVFLHVENCRRRWQELIVQHCEQGPNPAGGKRPVWVFQEQVDLRQRPELLEAKAPELALAGAELFYHLFEEPADPVLREVAVRLRKASQAGPLILTITSDDFFVPWGMLYVHPDPNESLKADGSNWKRDGFWGFRHVIEHNTRYIELENDLLPNANGQVPASINIDDGIDASLRVQCVAPQVAFFTKQTRLALTQRHRKAELRDALADKAFGDRIMYFYCHGIGAGPADAVNLRARIALTGGEEITAEEVRYWLKDRLLDSQPFVFINACQGGQMTTLFYQTLAAEFLRLHARGVIGAQIDMPAVFAGAYALRFFEEFLKGSNANRVRIGPLMRTLAQEFFNTYHNPLGLVYSLYRGADCSVRG